MADPKGTSGSGSGTRRRRLRVELTTYTLPAELMEHFCADPRPCNCAPTSTSGSSPTGSTPTPPPPSCDAQHPPAWWLTQEGHKLIQIGQGPLGNPGMVLEGQAMLVWASTGQPPTSGLFALQVPAILARWAAYFAAHADPCTQPGQGGGGGGSGSTAPRRKFRLEFTTFRGPVAPVAVSTRCVVLPDCDCDSLLRPNASGDNQPTIGTSLGIGSLPG